MSLALIVSTLLLAGIAPSAASADSSTVGVDGLLAAQLQRDPGGTVVGNRVVYADGSYFAAFDNGTYSISQCDSGYFCGWAQSSFSGSFFAVTGSGAKVLSWSTRSYWNHRSTVARLQNNGGTASTCFEPGESRATISSSYYNPPQVTLGTSSSC
jgi:hypothetical protein